MADVKALMVITKEGVRYRREDAERLKIDFVEIGSPASVGGADKARTPEDTGTKRRGRPRKAETQAPETPALTDPEKDGDKK